MGLEPSTVLEWRESELSLWTMVADKHRRAELLVEMAALTCAVWSPKDLTKLLRDQPKQMPAEQRERILARAEQISRMRMRDATSERIKGGK